MHTSTPRVVGQGRAKFQRRLGQSQEFLNSPEIRAAGRVEGAQSRLQAGSMKDLVEGEDPEAGQGEQEKLVQEEGQVLGLAAARAGEAGKGLSEEEQRAREVAKVLANRGAELRGEDPDVLEGVPALEDDDGIDKDEEIEDTRMKRR